MKDGMIVRELQHRLLCPKRCNLQNGTVKCFLHNFTHTFCCISSTTKTFKLGVQILIDIALYNALLPMRQHRYIFGCIVTYKICILFTRLMS